jgi:hypothetical protein
MNKVCIKCKQKLDSSMFHQKCPGSLDNRCKKCRSIIRKLHYIANRDKELANCQKYRTNNREKCKLATKKWSQNHRKQLLQYAQRYYQENKTQYQQQHKQYYQENKDKLYQYRRNRIKTNPALKLRINLARRILSVIKNQSTKKSCRTIQLLGCSKEQFKDYFQSKFTIGMTWDAFMRGEIHIDHVIPCVAFDLTKKEEQLKCFNYKNTQPLWATTELARKHGDFISIGNLNKGDTLNVV